MLIFDSDENYSKNLTLLFKEDNINVRDILINNVFDEFIEVDIILEDVIAIQKLDKILSQFSGTFSFYPDITNKDIFFELVFKSYSKVNIELDKYKIFCSPILTLHLRNEVISPFNENYAFSTRVKTATEEEKIFLSTLLERQKAEHYFNDQNVFVETEYRRVQKALEPASEIKSNLKINSGSINPFEDLERCVGLEKVKLEVERLVAFLKYKTENNVKSSGESLHMCFYGNPGTGKTTVARIMAGILFKLGFISENKCVEINGLELKGSNVGQTSVITKETIDIAKGGVLFIDEAYTLFDEDEEDFGKEAINMLLKEMEDNRANLIVILAGYYGPMQRLLDSNVGFRSRVKHYFDFEDYNEKELTEIFMNNLKNRHFFVDAEAIEKIFVAFKNARLKKNFGNGRYVENFLTKLEEEHILNVEKGVSLADTFGLIDVSPEVTGYDM